MTRYAEAVPILRKTAAFIRANKPRQEFEDYGSATDNRLCILGCIGVANHGNPACGMRLWPMIGYFGARCWEDANDFDHTTLRTFADFIEACDDDTLADMLESLDKPGDYE
jgi:hypothetical protein